MTITTHKECSAKEVWVGNTSSQGDVIARLNAAGISSARLGNVAYDIEGKPIDRNYMAPLILARADEIRYHEYMMERTFGPNWRRG